ncbi:hypothetical protein H0H92_007589 [Tricholoma furcatifolium]|nr:hypothetical protein H0H92_007589 [Tricholoma furcatifolium]
MGPGTRHDTLDDYMGFWNFRKTVDLGDSLLSSLVKAIPEAIVHKRAFEVFTQALQKEHAKELSTWEAMIVDWEADKTKPDPYFVQEDTVSVNEIRRQLAEEEHAQTIVEQAALDTLMTPANFIILGLDIEESQSNICMEAKKAITDAQKASLQQKRSLVLRKIQKYCEAQIIFMPNFTLPDDSGSTNTPELMSLHMPSSLPPEHRHIICNKHRVADMEERLHEGQASEALADLQRQLRIRTFANKFRNENASTQGTYTRMRTLQDQIETKIRTARDAYSVARDALLQLRGPGLWEQTYRVLQKEDIRSVNEHTVTQAEETAQQWAREVVGNMDTSSEASLRTVSTLTLQTGDGYRSLSWIWYNVTKEEIENDSDQSLHEGIRLEWLKARA